MNPLAWWRQYKRHCRRVETEKQLSRIRAAADQPVNRPRLRVVNDNERRSS